MPLLQEDTFDRPRHKRPATIIRDLRADLHFWQMHVRLAHLDRTLALSKVREIAAKMREAQKSRDTDKVS